MKDKIVLITGGTTGIGLATAQLLEAEGAQVIITGRNPANVEAAKQTLPRAIVLQSDSADIAAAQALGAEVKQRVPHLDAVFLNAGIATVNPFQSATPQAFDEIFNINVRGLFFQLQSLLPLLANPSSVVFTSSIAGSTAVLGASIYSATKAAVISLARSLAMELAPRGIRVNALSPGPIETPIFHKGTLPPAQVEQFRQHLIDKSLLKRIGTAEEVARAARYLLSEESSYVTGSELIIDGGTRLS
jgi:NAD(P)-dependent dehydrogenase (short-subunit alcohol dehydrogenase family)